MERGAGAGVKATELLEDRLLVEAEEGADARGGARPEMGDVVDLVLVQRDRLHEVDLHLVARRDAAHDVTAAEPAAGGEVLQEPIDQPYGVRDCAVRDPSGNLIRIQELR